MISLSGGQTGEAPIKVLLTDDYFSDVNLKSMRRIMNIVYVQVSLHKFDFDFGLLIHFCYLFFNLGSIVESIQFGL